MICTSTHGGAGYTSGTYIDSKGDIYCGVCKIKIGFMKGSEARNGYGPLVPIPEWVPDLRPTKVVYQEKHCKFCNKTL